MLRFIFIFLISLSLNLHSQSTIKTLYYNGKPVYRITDFDLHYHGGILVSGFVSSSIYYYNRKPLLSSFIGALVGTAVGIAKEEIWDRKWHNGIPSNRDKIATSAGSFFVMLPFNFVIHELVERNDKREQQRIQYSKDLTN